MHQLRLRETGTRPSGMEVGLSLHSGTFPPYTLSRVLRILRHWLLPACVQLQVKGCSDLKGPSEAIASSLPGSSGAPSQRLQPRDTRMSKLLLMVLSAVGLLHSASALSYSVCDSVMESYVTDTPRLTGTWPFYNLLYTCSGNLNLEGFSVDACVLNGTRCGQEAADAFCRYLGFDRNSPGMYSTVKATAPAYSMTGEWCMSPGDYAQLGHPNRTEFEAIKAAYNGPYCSSLSSVTCVRSRQSLSESVQRVADLAAMAPASAPSANQGEVPPGAAYIIANPPVSTAGRRMKVAEV